MAKGETFLCPDCGTEFGSKWARTEHERSCPVKQSAELRRIQEQLEWKRARIERWIQESYRSAARAFAAYHNHQVENGRRMHQWLAEDFHSSIRDLELLSDGVNQASKTHFPRLNKLRSDVTLLVEQVQDLTAILSVLNRDYGERT
jgi:DNA repair exonuclease SbcCD ATPase subunit